MSSPIFPEGKSPAVLFVKNGRGSAVPMMEGGFGECAWVLTGIWPPVQGCQIWIESFQKRFDGSIVNAEFSSKSAKSAAREREMKLEITPDAGSS